jgi:hypothetical protein
MRATASASVGARRPRSAPDGPGLMARRGRRPVRPLNDRTTEVVQVIEFVLQAGDAIQPVLYLDRQLLD